MSTAENEKNQKPTTQALLIQMDCLLQWQPVVFRKVCALDSVDKPFYLAIKNMLLLHYCTVSCDICSDFSVQEDCWGDTWVSRVSIPTVWLFFISSFCSLFPVLGKESRKRERRKFFHATLSSHFLIWQVCFCMDRKTKLLKPLQRARKHSKELILNKPLWCRKSWHRFYLKLKNYCSHNL